jgi:RHS repeat-associated protein
MSWGCESARKSAVGHTVALTDATGSVTSTNLYEAFGGIIASSGSSDNDKLANTKERDFSIDLDNHGFRYYDPATGRYITRDPSGEPDGPNNFLYVGNNPINHIDPQGGRGHSRSPPRRCFPARGRGVMALGKQLALVRRRCILRGDAGNVAHARPVAIPDGGVAGRWLGRPVDRGGRVRLRLGRAANRGRALTRPGGDGHPYVDGPAAVRV